MRFWERAVWTNPPVRQTLLRAEFGREADGRSAPWVSSPEAAANESIPPSPPSNLKPAQRGPFIFQRVAPGFPARIGLCPCEVLETEWSCDFIAMLIASATKHLRATRNVQTAWRFFWPIWSKPVSHRIIPFGRLCQFRMISFAKLTTPSYCTGSGKQVRRRD